MFEKETTALIEIELGTLGQKLIFTRPGCYQLYCAHSTLV